MCHTELSFVSKGTRRVLKDTLAEYRQACRYIADVVEENWDYISTIDTNRERMQYIESLIHHTRNNQPTYKYFDLRFYKFPSYYRRAAINFCLGEVKSYHTRLGEYNARRYDAISNGKRFKERPPVLNTIVNACPSMYKEQMYMMEDNTIRIKVRIRNTWDWIAVKIPLRDYKDLCRRCQQGKLKSPQLVFKYNKFYLAFPVEYECEEMCELPVQQQTILAVDLGVNRGATACVMSADGTIHERLFDPFTRERDQLNHLINRIRRVQRQTGTGNSISKVYTKLDGVKENYARQLASWINKMAVRYNVYGVVFENLKGFNNKKKRSARIHHWCKHRIQGLASGLNYRSGIRTFYINPRNTSALAYDGSGKVERGMYVHHGKEYYNYSICVFASGKQYNCDLNASYNIGARYFIRAYQKSIPETEWSQVTAKVPDLAKRTNCTMSTLISLSLQLCRKSA